MKEYLVQGTLGDTFIAVCKLYNIKEDIIVFHKTKHAYWEQDIKNIYSLLPNIEVKFNLDLFYDCPEITSNTHEQNMDFFPKFNTPELLNFERIKPYIVIQPHSGKSQGYNHKELDYDMIQELILKYVDQFNFRVVVLGTDPKFKKLEKSFNLIDCISQRECYSVIKNCDSFIGPEGLLSFMALSCEKPSHIYYSDYEAVKKRIVNTPWQNYCLLEKL